MKKEIDDILKHALTPTDEPDFWLNQKILSQAKETNKMKAKKIRKFTAIACSAALVLGIGSISVYAALKYLIPDKVAERVSDFKLMEAFSGEDAIAINETQNYGGYDVTLLGIVSGKNISEYLTSSNDGIHDDRTYSVVAIENSDGTPMPSTSDDAYNELSFLVSPLIAGYDPNWYNAFTLLGGYQDIVEDGILYRLSECDNIEIFADHDIYLCVSDGTFYNPEAYHFNETTGAITRNENYDGLNALFDLPLDKSKADPKAAAEYIKRIDTPEMSENGEDVPDGTETDINDEIHQWMNQLTPENIDEYAVPVESTRMVVTPDADGNVYTEYEIEGRGSGSGPVNMELLFPNGKTGMSDDFSFSYGDDSLDSMVIGTYTLNEDGTVTYIAYIPK